MADNVLNLSDSDEMDVGEGEGAAVPIRSIIIQSAPHSPVLQPALESPQIPIAKGLPLRKPYLKKKPTFPNLMIRVYEGSKNQEFEAVINAKRTLSGNNLRKSKTSDFNAKESKSLNSSLSKKHSPSKKELNYIDNRSSELRDEVQKKFENFTKAIREKETKECSFIPNNQKLKEKLLPSQINFGDRLALVEYKYDKNPKLEEPKFRPEICEKSRKINERTKASEPRHETLHKHYKKRSNKELVSNDVPENVTQTQITVMQPISPEAFHPQLNLRSKNLLRVAGFEENYHSPKEHALHENLVFASPKSEKVLIEKFSNEFRKASSGISKISYAHFIQILGNMHFLSDSNEGIEKALKLWDHISEDNSVDQEKLLMNLMAIMRYKIHIFFRNEENLIAQEECDRMHRKYALLFQNRNNSKTIFNLPSQFTFTPEINEKATVEGPEYSKVEDRLAEKHNLVKEKKERLKEKYLQMKELECTFKPQILNNFEINKSKATTTRETIAKDYLGLATEKMSRNEALYSLASIKNQKNALRIQEKLKKDDEMNKYTFSPNLTKKPLQYGSPKIIGTEKAIQRMFKARENKELQRAVSEKGFPFQGKIISLQSKQSLIKTPEAKTQKNSRKIGQNSKIRIFRKEKSNEIVKSSFKGGQNNFNLTDWKNSEISQDDIEEGKKSGTLESSSKINALFDSDYHSTNFENEDLNDNYEYASGNTAKNSKEEISSSNEIDESYPKIDEVKIKEIEND